MTSLPRIEKHAVIVVFVLALIVRVFALMIVPPPAIDDSAEAAYLAGAKTLLGEGGFRDQSYPVYSPPLYGILIALCQVTFGPSLWPVKCVQLLIDSITVVFLFLILRKVFDVATGALGAVILALYPFSVYLAISIASEPLVTCLLAGFVLLAVSAVQQQRIGYFAAAGIVLGLATLTRATTQFLPLFVLPVLVFLRQRERQLLKCAAFGFLFLLTILPWTIRNYVVLNDFIPVATGGGVVVLMGSQESYLTIPGKPAMYANHPPKAGGKPSEVDRHWRNAGLAEHLKHLERDPLAFIRFNAMKFLRLWYATESGDNHIRTLAPNLPIYILACVGVLRVLKKRQRLALIPLSVIGYYVVLHWASLPLFRYMIPVMPYVIGLAAFAMVELAGQWGLAPQLLLSSKGGVINEKVPE